MITEIRKSRLRRLWNQGLNITQCARKCKMDPKTASRILKGEDPPRDKGPRSYRTHPDRLAPFWPEIEAMLQQDSALKAYILFEEMRTRHPETFPATWKRTLERRVRDWKIDHRVEQEVTFDQEHLAGDVLAIDFTSMNDLKVTIAGERFDHLVFHGVLTFSNWEYAEVCLSESFEAVARGIQNAFHAMGGLTERIRFDSMTAAVNNLSTERHFQANFRRLLEHFEVKPHRINVRSPEENGDCESSHGHFKDHVDQCLRVRGDRNFAAIEEYKAFLKRCIATRNQPRETLFQEEQAVLASLLPKPFPTYTEIDCMVGSNSIITVKQNRYSIPSCFIGHRVTIRIHSDQIELWYAGKRRFEAPRLIGSKQEFIDFRHVIDTLVRKPGAFAHYRYREHMFPTLEFRKAFDYLGEILGDAHATRVYLRMLQCVKQEGLAVVEPIAQRMMAMGQNLTKKQAFAMLDEIQPAQPATNMRDVEVEIPDLDSYDDLLEHKEVLNDQQSDLGREFDRACENATEPIGTGFPFEETSPAYGSSFGDQYRGASRQGELESLGVSQRADDPRMPDTQPESNPATLKSIGIGAEQDLGSNRLDPIAENRTSKDGIASHGRVLEATEQRADLWSSGYGKDALAQCVGGFDGSSGIYGMLCTVCEVGPTSSGCETGLETTATVIEDWEVLDLDHRRLGLCSTESRGDGSALYADRRSLREIEHPAEQQPAVLEVGEHLQGSYDHSGGHRSTRASQRDLGAQRSELSARTSKQGPSQPRPQCIIVSQEKFNSGILTVAKAEF